MIEPNRVMTNNIELSIPVQADLVVLARLTVAAVASRAGFDIEEIEDLRLAVDELCVSTAKPGVSGRLNLSFLPDNNTIEITCTFVPDGTGGVLPMGESFDSDLSDRILDALVTEHGRGEDSSWLRKGRSALPS
jgi:anti-sigma regulatory factor (Ser/Thr protein kinase)